MNNSISKTHSPISVSVILCAYNSGKSILKALTSIRESTCNNFEIIVVNDGSTDKTACYINKFCNDNPSISTSVIHNIKNRGLFASRAIGVKNALGEYIGFCDADDSVHKDMYNLLYKKAIESQSEVVFCNVTRLNKSKVEIQKHNVMTKEMLDEMMLDPFTVVLQRCLVQSVYVWMYNKIIKKSLLMSINEIWLQFESSLPIQMAEDVLLSLYIYSYATKYDLVSDFLYNYHVNSTSLVGQMRKNVKSSIKSLRSYDQVMTSIKSFLISKNILSQNIKSYEKCLSIIRDKTFVKYIKFKELKYMDDYFNLYKTTLGCYPDTRKIIKKLLYKNMFFKIVILVSVSINILLVFIDY